MTVIGSGPNGLVAAITMARAGRRVTVLEAAATPGGGCRTAELTEPGFRHDVCATVLPLALGSPALRDLPLTAHGVLWIHPEIALAHPLEDGTALLHRSLDDTAAGLGADGAAWRRLLAPLVRGSGPTDDLLALPSIPRHPVAVARFARVGLPGAERVARRRLSTPGGRALFGGLAAHSVLPLDRWFSSGVGLTLAAYAHLVGWPVAQGGAQTVVDALVAILREHGGDVVCDHRVDDLAELPPGIVLADVAPSALVRMAGERMPERARRRYARFRRGPGTFKLDYALSGPVPWTDPAVATAGTVHVGGTFEEIAEAEATVGRGGHPARPFVLTVQATACDPTRAPAGQHTLWAYCHVPNGSTVDMTEAVERQIERFAPGFRDVVIARHVTTAGALEAYNANCVGGDITGGLSDWRQLVSRPVLSRTPWRTSIPGVYLCSSSTPPGGGVHGMSGLHAARTALRDHPN
ncbi:MAG TPA: NAD(P)/FAD-dependent oxidoreductase [Ilumatobacteraceae bacterium]|nr:NAD(P)/FAD-dependent oxidoreductase [Ilumatobacteraceae bacterium]